MCGMEEQAAYTKELLARSKFWRFIHVFGSCFIRASDDQITALDRVSFYAPLAIPTWLSVQFKIFFDSHSYLQTCMWAITVTFLLGRAIWRLYGRYDDHVAIPQISGTWIRKDISGVITIYQDGYKIKAKFPIGSIDHDEEGAFNPIQRRFNITTIRVDAALPVEQQRYVYTETWWLLDKNSLLFHVECNALGKEEAGILKRRA
jgi:hypothetical protein